MVEVTQRLHVAGLTPSITAAHLRDRFAIFGKVGRVEEMAPDALGNARHFTYLTISATPAQLKKCLNIMSGSTWRGAHLRIAPARPTYLARLEAERHPPTEVASKEAAKRRKRARVAMGEEVGKEAQDMRVVTGANYARRKFWTKTEDGYLVRPIAMRPDHPLPPLPHQLGATSSTNKRLRGPPARMRRRVINPPLWQPEHVNEEALLSGAEPWEVAQQESEWVFEEVPDLEGQSGSEEVGGDEGWRVIGVWRRGEEEEVVRVKRRRVDQVDEAKEFDDLEGFEAEMSDSGSELFGHRGRADVAPTRRIVDKELGGETSEGDEGGDETIEAVSDFPAGIWTRSTSPLFPNHNARVSPSPTTASGGAGDEASPSPLPRSSEDDAASPLFPTRKSLPPAREAVPLSAARTQPVTTASESPKLTEAIKRLNPTQSAEPPSAPRPLSRPQPQVSGNVWSPAQPLQASQRTQSSIPEPIRAQVKAERNRDLNLLSRLLAGGDEAAPKPGMGEWAGFSESESEDENAEGTGTGNALRLRGGAADSGSDESDKASTGSDSGSEDEDTGGDSTGSSESDSSDDDPEDSDSNSSTGTEDTNAANLASTESDVPAKPTLRDLFAPISKTSFASNTTGREASITTGPAKPVGFSLATLDPHLEMEELDIPLAPSTRAAALIGAREEAQEHELQLLPVHTARAEFELDPSRGMFFLTEQVLRSYAAPVPTPSQRISSEDVGKQGDQAPGSWVQQRWGRVSEEDADADVDTTAQDDEKQEVKEVHGFWAQETDEEMRSIWERDRLGLTRDWKRRGREGRKAKRRRGGGHDE